MQNTRPGLCCEMRWDPRFPALPSVWKPLGCRFLPLPGVCRAQEWGCVPRALLPVLQGPGTAPGAGTRLRLHWCLPSCAGILAHPLGWEFQHGRSLFAHTVLELLGGCCWSRSVPTACRDLLSSGILHLQLPGEGNAGQGMTGDIPGWGEGAPLQPQEKLVGLRVVTAGLEEPPRRDEGTACGRKYLAELEFLVEDPEFRAELGWDPGRNFGQRLCAGQGGELCCVPSGCHVPGCVPCPSRRGLCAPRRVLAPSRLVLPPGCCQTWQWEGNSLERGVTGIRKRNTASPGLLKTGEQIKAWGEVSHKF